MQKLIQLSKQVCKTGFKNIGSPKSQAMSHGVTDISELVVRALSSILEYEILTRHATVAFIARVFLKRVADIYPLDK
ncbi:unnamed protein product [Arctia plantaginis]|uniref:Uncharacterized protein n=1 Tax=Arctia plantaginis TaxID=874455 RepID=A0A8S1AW78_ARCPL|nr:unnamed protein product [Arctia plantaginis]